MSDAIESTSKHIAHRNAVERKYQKIAGKQAILDTWLILNEDHQEDQAYLRELRKRIRTAEVNLVAMRP